jgi:hypothetical protein
MQSASYSSHDDGSGGGGTTVELGGIAPGHYEMELRTPAGDAGRVASVDATSDHQVVDTSAAQVLAEVSGKVAMADGGSLPERLSVSLMSQQGQENSNARVEKDGSFEIRGVRPGIYELVANGGDSAIAATAVTAAGAVVDGHTLKVSGAPVMVTATLVESTASVNGFAKSDGKPVAGVMVVLVPAKPGENRELFRRDQSDSDGSFLLGSVIPGEYTVVAIQNGWTLDWARAEVIGHYLPRGLKIHVPAHGHDIQLKDAVEVQAK